MMPPPAPPPRHRPGAALGGLLGAVYQRDASNAGGQRWLRLGGRLTYSPADRIKLTLAPAWTLEPGFWSRPELRLFW